MNGPLGDVIESFFRANYDLSPKTERWYRQNLAAFSAFVVANQRRPAMLQDLKMAMVASGVRTFSAHLMRHTWATNFMRAPGASLLELRRQG